MDLIAHRGFAGVNPENTVTAARAAAERADMIEIDVRRCGSDELVVIHDETVDRVTDDTGAVAAFTATELGAMDVLGSGDGIPTLERLASAVPDSVGLNVELKETDIAADTLELLSPVENELLVSSFLAAPLATCRELEPVVARALLFHEDPAANLALASELECAALHPHHSVTEPIVELAHDRGLAVNAWTVEVPRQATALAALEVDGIIADVPDLHDPV